MVLGIYDRAGGYRGVPRPGTVVQDGDRLVLYGEDDTIAAVADRTGGAEGDVAHDRAVAGYREREAGPGRQ